MKNKLLSLASLLAVFNVNAIEIGPTGSGAELTGFIDVFYHSQDNNGILGDDRNLILTMIETITSM